MRTPTLLLALALAVPTLALVPAAGATDAPCVLGDDRAECLVAVEWVVCVTEPCDTLTVCVAYGRYCIL